MYKKLNEAFSAVGGIISAALFLVVSLFLLTYAAAPAQADGFSMSGSYEITDSVAYAVNLDGTDTEDAGATVGIFLGTLGEYTKGETKLLGLGGILISAAPRPAGENDADNSIGYGVSFVPLTLFDDIFQVGIGYNLTDRERMVSVGISLSKAGKTLNPF